MNGIRWSGKGYNALGYYEFEMKDGKGMVKEFTYSGYMQFIGEYTNGKRNGKGKEYHYVKNRCIIGFEGEYINGLRNGEGKLYLNNGEVEFEGIFLDGNKWKGNALEFNTNDNFEFEGQYLNGKRWNGILIEYDADEESIIFDGKLINGEKFEN